jgi:hypothetical protein
MRRRSISCRDLGYRTAGDFAAALVAAALFLFAIYRLRGLAAYAVVSIYLAVIVLTGWRGRRNAQAGD